MLYVLNKKILSIVRKLKWSISFLFVNRNTRSLREVNTCHGHLLAFINEDPGREQWLYGEYERSFAEYLFSNIKDDDVCLDIGANVGFYSLLMARRARTGTVHSIEPNPSCIRVLKANKELYMLDNMLIHQIAITPSTSKTYLSATADSAYSSTREFIKDNGTSFLEVEGLSLDDFIKANALNKIDVIKLDIEGNEYQVLSAVKRLFIEKDLRPRIIMAEINNPIQSDGSTHLLFQLLRKHGYAEIDSDISTHYNFIFVIPDGYQT